MHTNTSEFTRLQRKIFRFLCAHAGEKYNQNQLAKLLKVSPNAVAKSLPQLKKMELIKVTESGTMNLTLIEFNVTSRIATQLKRVENMSTIYESGLQQELEDAFPGCTIVLFGSFARGEDRMSSDIDIAVIGSKEKKMDLDEYNKEFNRIVRITYFTQLKDVHKELRENICNGIVLAGGIEL